MFRPQTGAISAFLTTLRLEMMMIEICMVTITLQLCVIINMKTKYWVLIFEQICPENLVTVDNPVYEGPHTCPQYGVFRYGGYCIRGTWVKSMHWLMAGAAGGSTCWCFAQGGSDTREGTG